MQVAVVGGGIVGVCTAFFLAQEGHEVVVVERQSNVAEGTSFGSAGITTAAHVKPLGGPGMPGKILSMMLKKEAAVGIDSKFDAKLWRWARKWLRECDLERYTVNRERMHRIASYNTLVLNDLQQRFHFEFERTVGYLQLYRTMKDVESSESFLSFLKDGEVSHRLIEPEEVYAIEPGLNRSAPLARALYVEDEISGNCPLFCKQLRLAAQSLGVVFHFGEQVASIEPPTHTGAHTQLKIGERSFGVDAVVVAAGAESMNLLEPLGIRLPFYPVRAYAATVPVRNFDDAPLAAVADYSNLVSVTRMGTRMRLAGTLELAARNERLRPGATRTLLKIAQDWFPDAANYNAPTFWSGLMPTLPDGPPILGATSIPNLYLNIGHAEHGWAMAAGSGRILADIVSKKATGIDVTGLTLARYL
jgi:D-amino-acid dehydrogenase